MQLDLKKLPFGQTMSRHLLFEEWDPKGRGYEKGYWLALANESSNLFGFGGMERSAGQILLKPTADGVPVEAELTATHAQAELKAAAGSIRFAIDGAALLLEGSGLGLQMRVKVNPGEVASRTADGCILILGATRYIIEMKQGSCKVETRWNLDNLCSYDPELTLTPENGRLEAVFWDCDTTCRKPEAAATVTEAAAKADRSFEDFRSRLWGTDELHAYVLWQSLMSLRGETFVVNNKAGDICALSRNQCLAALAFRDPADRIALLLPQLRCMTAKGLVPNQVKPSGLTFEAAVPMWGAVLVQFSAEELRLVPEETREELYDLLRRAVAWWETERQTGEGEFFYAYAHEGAWEGLAELPENEPAVAPDLSAWMNANYSVLAMLAALMKRKEEARAFAEKGEIQNPKLVEMADENGSVCRGVLSGKVLPCEQAPALLQSVMLLGGGHTKDHAEARRSLEKLVRLDANRSDPTAASFYEPTCCALLLALEERS